VVALKVVELKPEQLPLLIRFKVGDEVKEYLLLKTKQDKLLLNKSNGDCPVQNS
jgi:hypothetical protein